MMTIVLNGIEVINAGLDGLANGADLLSLASGIPTWDWTILAQNVEDPDVMGQMQRAFQNFVESGQVWALIIGFVLGFGFKSLLPG
ncbi:MAG: hypothetical protein SVX43_03520 [Cyanobacteriota bacterium]|nr:hypothetical protein [Cyanobacteriota bacterium]